MSRTLQLTILFVVFVKSEERNLKCVQRDYGNGGTVCVCNESYCDTIEPLGPFSDDEYHVYVSSQSGLRFEHEKKKFETRSRGEALEVTVNPKKTFQKIYGFGGAFTDAACLNINSLSRGARKQLLASYFSPQGIEYNFGRVPIGGTDFSTRKYSLDDTPNDVSLQNFNLSPEDVDHKIPVILASQKLSKKTVRLVGSAWSAPPWMKTNNDYTCFGLLKLDYYDVWSKYHLKFLEEYEKYGLKFWGLTTGNEPTAGLLPYYSFNCLGWTPFSQAKWVADHFGPQLKNSRFNETLIIGIDDQRFTLPWWPKIFFNNQKTRSYVAGIGLHWYWDKYFPPQLLDLTHLVIPEKFILYTEACYVKDSKSPVILGSWQRGEGYASNIISTDDLEVLSQSKPLRIMVSAPNYIIRKNMAVPTVKEKSGRFSFTCSSSLAIYPNPFVSHPISLMNHKTKNFKRHKPLHFNNTLLLDPHFPLLCISQLQLHLTLIFSLEKTKSYLESGDRWQSTRGEQKNLYCEQNYSLSHCRTRNILSWN